MVETVSNKKRNPGNRRKKRKRTGSFILPVLCILMCITAAALYAAFFFEKGSSSDARAFVDGHIETGGSSVQKALAGLEEAEPADIITDKKDVGSDTDNENEATSDPDRIALVFVGLTGEKDTDSELIKLLADNGIKAGFALSAAEAEENPDEISEMRKGKIEIISNGTSGESNVQLKADSDMVGLMLKSREQISAAADSRIPLIYLNSTAVNADILCAAAVSGYDAVIAPSEENILADGSLESREDAERFINRLHGDTIIVFNLRGKPEEIKDENFIVREKPAVDKKPEADSEKAESKEPTPVIEQVEWLISAVTERNAELSTEYVENFEKTDGMTVLKQQAKSPEAKLSPIFGCVITDKQQTGIGVKGLPNEDAAEKFTEALKKSDMGATFFVSPEEAEQRIDVLKDLIAEGFTAGMYIDADSVNGLSADEIFDFLYEKSRTLKNETGSFKTLLIADGLSTEALTAVRASASLLGLCTVRPRQSDEPQKGAMYVADAADGIGNLTELAEKIRAAGLKAADMETLIEQSGSMQALTPMQITDLRSANQKKLADITGMVYTSERSLSFVMYGFGNPAAVIDVADILSEYGGHAAFYATLDELMADSSAVEYALKNGNEIGICFRASGEYPQTFGAVASYINSWNEYAMWRYGIKADTMLMPYNTANDETLEAVSAYGLNLIKPAFAAVRDEDKYIGADETGESAEKTANLRLMRGSFTSFNMGYYYNDSGAAAGNSVFGAVFRSFIEQHVDTLAYHSYNTGLIEDESRFNICTAGELLHSEKKYEFLTDGQSDISIDKNVLSEMKDDNGRFDYMAERYIGTSFVTSKRKLPGFSDSEIRRLDKKGRFTNDKVLFLTFDDWGTEQSINELLYVLDKYNVKATFFVTTQHVDSNPNLLRAIAEHGHQIGSHTDAHLPLSDSEDGSNRAFSLTDEEAETLRQDIVTSYDKLYKYVGDVAVDGKKSLSKMFRPPTLAVSREGISQVFDVGYEYSVSGDMSTNDYKAESFDDMVSQLKNGITDGGDHISVHDGSIIVMHMLENARYTAQALDKMIPLWQEEGYAFARLDEYLSDENPQK